VNYVDALVENGQLTERQADRWRADCRRLGYDEDAFDFGLANWVRPHAPTEWDNFLRQWRRHPYTIKHGYGPAVRYGMIARARDHFPPGAPARLRQKVEGAIRGYLGAVGGLENGRHNPGRKPLLTSEQAAQIARLKDRGLSLRAIALRVFGDVRYKDRVRRHLNHLCD
jgi:hypothetical protein